MAGKSNMSSTVFNRGKLTNKLDYKIRPSTLQKKQTNSIDIGILMACIILETTHYFLNANVLFDGVA